MNYIEIKQRKTCNKCKAYDIYNGCELGYKIDTGDIAHNKPVRKPIEACPKPLTYNDLIECCKRWRKENIS